MDPIEIRKADRNDAPALITYVKEITAEPGSFLLTGPGEFNLTIEEEEDYIQAMQDAENSLILLAESGSKIVGEINLRGGTRRAEQHTAVLGISVRSGYRGLGLGTRLMSEALAWADARSSLKRIELHVFSGNLPAIHLYKKFGFVTEGRRRMAIFKEGGYQDDLIMALLLD